MKCDSIPAEPGDAPEFVDEFTVSARLGIPVKTLRNLRSKGGGPVFYKIGRQVRYRIDEAREWALTTRARSTAEAQSRQREQRAA